MLADANISLVDGTNVGVQEGADDRDGAAHPAHEGHFGVEEDHRRYDDDHALERIANGMRYWHDASKRHKCSLVVEVVRDAAQHSIPDKV